MSSGTVAIRFTGDLAPLSRALGEADSKLEGFGQKMTATGKKMMGVGAKMSIGLTAPLALLGKAAVGAGSDLEETLSKSNTVFGANAKAIEKWSDTSARAFGQSKTQALEAASSFGNMFVQLGIGSDTAADMSTKMTELASDFASFHNADITEVLNAQEAAFRGEYDAVQRFVPTINAAAVEQKALKMGLATTTSELDAQDKALAVQTLLLEGAGDAAGDFARTSDGLANSQRIATAEAENAKAKLGTGLLPITQKVTEWAGKLGEKFGNLSQRWQTTILVGGAVIAAIGPLVTLVGAITTAVGGLSVAMTFLAANPVVLVVAAVAALAAGLVYAYKTSDTFRSIIDTAFRAVATAANFMRDVIVTAVQAYVNVFMGSVEMIVKGAAKAFGWVPGLGGKLKGAAKAVEGFRDDVNGFLDGIKSHKSVTVEVTTVNRVVNMVENVAPGQVPQRMPRFHSGGVFRAPAGRGEGMAVLRDGEEVSAPGKANAAPVTVTNHFTINQLPGQSPEELVRMIVEYERRNGKGWRAA